jgi:hypothetical protein
MVRPHRGTWAQQALRTLPPLLFLFALAAACHAQNRDVLCNLGTGNFTAQFRTGVAVRVGAARNGGLAERLCQAALSWGNQNLVIADQAAQVDVDAFGSDLGLGVPVVAFQIKKSANTCCVEYRIYSLRQPPKLLQTITGGDFFSAADTDLDGAVEIWTDDAASVDGFDHLVVGQLDFSPTVVLRYTRGQLFDVSPEFQPYFDEQIATVKAKLDAQDLRDFQASDGILPAPVPFSAEALRRRDRLQGVKVKVLEIVWAYLYSGRDDEAWRALAELWPPGDAARMRAAILQARGRGIRAQVHGVSTGASARHKNSARIYDALTETQKGKAEVIPPEPILLRRAAPLGPEDQDLATSELQLILVVDAAGKVRSAQAAADARRFDAGMKSATANWKFIPAFKGTQAVASRSGFIVSLTR